MNPDEFHRIVDHLRRKIVFGWPDNQVFVVFIVNYNTLAFRLCCSFRFCNSGDCFCSWLHFGRRCRL
jgi:hypothetical protein